MSSVASLRARHGTPMQASMEQFVLAHPDMSTEVIADGMHLSPELLEFAYRMKGAERLCLVTDANRALGQPPGRYRFGPIDTGSWFESDGRVGFVPGNGLASSVVGMDTMVRNMKTARVRRLPEVIRMASLTPAERAGIEKDTGSLEKGKARGRAGAQPHAACSEGLHRRERYIRCIVAIFCSSLAIDCAVNIITPVAAPVTSQREHLLELGCTDLVRLHDRPDLLPSAQLA